MDMKHRFRAPSGKADKRRRRIAWPPELIAIAVILVAGWALAAAQYLSEGSGW